MNAASCATLVAMSRPAITIALVLAFLAGCVAARAGFIVPPAAAADTPRYEYLCHIMGFSYNEDELTAFLNKHGAEGWQLKPLGDGPALCFERPLGG